jgi:hypothetical protein
MKRLLAFAFLLFAAHALAHPGHGKPGLFHDHNLVDLFANGALILAGTSVLALLCWKVMRSLKKNK